MFVSNPFAELSAIVSPSVMQTFVWLMIMFVVGGTIFDVIHKGSAKYFFANWGKAQDKGSRRVGSGEITGMAVQTMASEVLTSSEFCNPHRRIAHLLGMYGFIAYVISTAVMVFKYPVAVDGTPGIWPFLWTLGCLAICVGGYWFWFFIRADVKAEGQSPFRLVRADLFILSLLASATFGILWQITQANGSAGAMLFLVLYLISTLVLFAGVPWSKFSHMFFKPAAALQKRVAVANGQLDNLPAPADRNDPADRDRHSMELLKDAPKNMGLGIKREQPNHY